MLFLWLVVVLRQVVEDVNVDLPPLDTWRLALISASAARRRQHSRSFQYFGKLLVIKARGDFLLERCRERIERYRALIVFPLAPPVAGL